MSDNEEIGIIKKALNGPATSVSAIVIATVLVMQSLGVIGEDSGAATNESMIAFRARVPQEHKVNQTAVADLAKEMRLLTEANKEMLIILRDMKQEARDRP